MAPLLSPKSIREKHVAWARTIQRTLGALSAACVLAAASDASAYVVKHSKAGAVVHWAASDVAYSLDPSVAVNVAGGAEATRTAMQSWSGAAGAPDMAIVPSNDAPKVPGLDRKNGIFFMKDGYAPAGKALAITVLTYDNASGSILDADIIVNGVYAFAVLDPREGTANASGPHLATTDNISHDVDDPTPGLTYDLHHVIAHELGHSLGMNDEMERKDALMFRYTTPNDASLRSPGSDDISGISEIYANRAEADQGGCGGATVAPKKPSLAASHLAMVATLAFMLFLVLRARSDRRARLGFVLAAVSAGLFLMPSASKGATRSTTLTARSFGHARATVTRSVTTIEHGIFKTAYDLTTDTCRAASCPRAASGSAWGGTIGDLRQEVGGAYAPHSGDAVDVSFTKLPDALAPLAKPLAGRTDTTVGTVRVLTPAPR